MYMNSKTSVGWNVLICFLPQPLDYETKKAYTFTVEALNAHLDPVFHSFGPFKDTATVKINVLDVDEPPVFSKPSYTMDVYEDTPAGTIIGAVTAQDLDAGNSAVRYVCRKQTRECKTPCHMLVSKSCQDILSKLGKGSWVDLVTRKAMVYGLNQGFLAFWNLSPTNDC